MTDPETRLRSALLHLSGFDHIRVEACSLNRGPSVLFDTAQGRGGLRPLRSSGLQVSPLDPEDGVRTAEQLRTIEPLISAIERALEVAIEPREVGEVDAGLGFRLAAQTTDQRTFEVELILPEALSGDVPVRSEAGERLFEAIIPAPALPDDAEAGDLLLLAADTCTIVSVSGDPFRIEASLLSSSARPASWNTDDASVVIEGLRLSDQAIAAIAAGAPFDPVAAQSPGALYRSSETERRGGIVPLADHIALRLT